MELHGVFLNRSDGRVVWSVCFWIGRLGVRFRVGSNQWLLNWYSQLPCFTFSIEGTAWRTSRQVYLLCRWERHVTGFPHLGVVDRWPTTPKRARIAHRSLSRDKRINMPVIIKKIKTKTLCIWAHSSLYWNQTEVGYDSDTINATVI